MKSTVVKSRIWIRIKREKYDPYPHQSEKHDPYLLQGDADPQPDRQRFILVVALDKMTEKSKQFKHMDKY
jgi:hypothetical protein